MSVRFPISHLSSMSRIGAVSLALVSLAINGATASAFGAKTASEATLAHKVNPFVGTGKGPGDTENLYPGPVAPFGMVQLSPDTEDHGLGYHYDQMTIKGFSMTHMSGVGCPNEGEVFMMPTTGAVATQESDFQSPYSHNQESASPGYYQVRLDRTGINAELAATERTGMVRFTYPGRSACQLPAPHQPHAQSHHRC